MTAGYTPQHGDRVRVVVEGIVDGNPAAGALNQRLVSADGDDLVRPVSYDLLAKAGVVELVARAEPDWQPQEIGEHVETGELYVYAPHSGPLDSMPWWPLADLSGANRSRVSLAGKLRRMRLVPEDEPVNSNAGPLPPTAQSWHSHQCPFAGHGWQHYAPGCTQDVLLACADEEHHQYVAEDDPAEVVVSHWHVCRGGAERQPGGTPQDHQWEHVGTRGCGEPEELACPDCGPTPGEVPQVGDGGTNEPPLGRYQDAAGDLWKHTSQGWHAPFDNARFEWCDIDDFRPFKPLFTVDELIPDPDNKDALDELVYEAQDHKPRGEYAVTVVIRAALQALRARADRGGAA